MKYVKVEEIKGYEDIRINIGTAEAAETLDSKTALRMFALNSEPGEGDVEAWVKVQKVIEAIGKADDYIAVEDDHWTQAMKNKKKIAAQVFGINCPQILENFDALVSDEVPD
jgi:hypothetical protein|tara:strand:- start:5304 stop:5639 length:336 start_codon:yes stop_codon:yes gene_type:complete